jgi:predicted DNA-binding transcriptional regulator YafY
MRVIHTNLYREAAFLDKPKGWIKKLIDLFRGDFGSNMKDVVDDALDYEDMESAISEEIPQPVEYEVIGEETVENAYGPQREVMEAINFKRKLRINYAPLNKNVVISRTITPFYIYHAQTGNTIVVTWCEEWDDWRAFALNNIISADQMEEEELNQNWETI